MYEDLHKDYSKEKEQNQAKSKNQHYIDNLSNMVQSYQSSSNWRNTEGQMRESTSSQYSDPRLRHSSGINHNYESSLKLSRDNENSKSISNYPVVHFEQRNDTSDFSRSYSFENNSKVKIRGDKNVNDKIQTSYAKYEEKPSIEAGKENFVYNYDTQKYTFKKNFNESLLMQKVSRILEKRDLNKKDSDLSPRSYQNFNPRKS